ncbi:sugar transferase [Paenibacillus sp. MBLB4367]|uniref:sugar transferase n=1 Tax=Paenibacillus sp. MBLB4367 TaxID=3384767 RepID=UPI0039083FEE
MSQRILGGSSQKYDKLNSLDDRRIFFSIVKRMIDVILSLVILFISFPFLLLVMLVIRIESPGPALYFQERVGKGGGVFKIIKLRSMYIDAESNGPQWASTNDSRITKMGAFIRKTRIDELPQLINVLKNDMSLIGPRPERPIFTMKFNNEIPGFNNRLNVKPGLTGWAQINGGYELSPEEKLQYDIQYIERRSFFLEFKIFCKTIVVVITGNGAR